MFLGFQLSCFQQSKPPVPKKPYLRSCWRLPIDIDGNNLTHVPLLQWHICSLFKALYSSNTVTTFRVRGLRRKVWRQWAYLMSFYMRWHLRRGGSFCLRQLLCLNGLSCRRSSCWLFQEFAGFDRLLGVASQALVVVVRTVVNCWPTVDSVKVWKGP